MPRDSLSIRLYFEPHLHQLARAVSYDGKTDAEMRPIVKRLIEAHGSEKVSEALMELTRMERDTNRTVLMPHVRTLCTQLLGPAPEHPLHDFLRYGPPDLMGEIAAVKWQERYRKEQEKKAKENAEENGQEPSKKRARKGRSHSPVRKAPSWLPSKHHGEFARINEVAQPDTLLIP